MARQIHDADCLAASDLVNAILGDDRPEPPCTCAERQKARKRGFSSAHGGADSLFGCNEGASLGDGNYIKTIARTCWS
jgi:hypothetical protein